MALYMADPAINPPPPERGPPPPGKKYGWFEADGEKYRQWIDNNPAAPPCPFTFPSPDLEGAEGLDPVSEHKEITNPEGGPLETIEEMCDRYRIEDIAHIDHGYRISRGYGGQCTAFFAEGLVVLEYINRRFNRETGQREGPYTCDIANYHYNGLDFENDLHYVFVDFVINIQTVEFLENHLFTAANGLAWPPKKNDVYVIDFDANDDRCAAEYHGLLGTPMGKVAAGIVLGRWPRGTHYISKIRIIVYDNTIYTVTGEPLDRQACPYFMFQIDPVPPAPGPAAPGPAVLLPFPPAPAGLGPRGIKRRGENKPRDVQPSVKKRKTAAPAALPAPPPPPVALPGPAALGLPGLPLPGLPPGGLPPVGPAPGLAAPGLAAPGPAAPGPAAPGPAAPAPPDNRGGPGSRKRAIADRAAILRAMMARKRSHRSGYGYE